MTRVMASHSLLLLVALCGLLVPNSARAFSLVVIDPGHGGHNLGQSVGGVYEKWLALDLSFRLEKYLKKKRLRTVLTRRNDTFIPLDKRAEIAKRYRKNSIFVSIHFNGARSRTAHGLETFYYSRSGYDLAARVQRRMVAAVRGNNRGAKFARFHVLRNSPQPSILVECGFLTHAAERERCKSGRYRQALAEAIGKGILDYRSAVRSGHAR